jgi:hypothetical protein
MSSGKSCAPCFRLKNQKLGAPTRITVGSSTGFCGSIELEPRGAIYQSDMVPMGRSRAAFIDGSKQESGRGS